ncbi:hypothetical protein [Streptomyces sp. SID7909]|nr:hypothetical protein [Streptomyces sp. SID7909]
MLRDDYPLPPLPWRPLKPHHDAFADTLAGLPVVRDPRLRGYCDESRWS